MALDLNLSAPDRLLDTQTVSRLLQVPLQTMTADQIDEIRLQILDTIFDPEGAQINQGICADSYHFPILFLQGSAEQTDLQIEAWVRSALYYSYNMVLLTHSPLSVSSQTLLNEHPEAIKHLVIRSFNQQDSKHLLAAIPQFIPSQEPHLYLTQVPEAPQLKQAMQAGFLAVSLVPQALIEDGQTGFILEARSAKALAQELFQLLESAEHDWSYLQNCVTQAQSQIS